MKENKTPEIYCELLLIPIENKEMNRQQLEIIREKLVIAIDKKDIFVKVNKVGNLWIQICEMDYEPFWFLEDALEKLFVPIIDKTKEISKMAQDNNLSVFLDIAFFHDGNFPGIIIDGNNMKVIHALNANIGIDAFYGGFTLKYLWQKLGQKKRK